MKFLLLCLYLASTVFAGGFRKKVVVEPMKPVQIISVVRKIDERSFQINENNLNKFIKNLQNKGTEHVSVVSVVGKFRDGKSFLLNLMLKYLKHKYSEHHEEHDSNQWFDGEVDNKADSVEWFHAANQNNTVTTGIWIYNEPIMVGKTAIVLMDTQGLFDHAKIDGKIFGLSSLLSSYQIVNNKGALDEQLLECIDLFSTSAKKISKPKLLPALQLIMRDYSCYTDKNNYENCESEMKTLKEDTFQNNHFLKDQNDMRKRISTNYDGKIKFFGFPHPGGCVDVLNKKIDLSKIEETFKFLIEKFFENYFAAVKRPSDELRLDEIVTPALFEHKIREFIPLFNNQKDTSVNMLDAKTKLEEYEAMVARNKNKRYWRSVISRMTIGSGTVGLAWSLYGVSPYSLVLPVLYFLYLLLRNNLRQFISSLAFIVMIAAITTITLFK